MPHKDILVGKNPTRKGVASEPTDSRQKDRRNGSVIGANREAMFVKFDRGGTLPRSLAATYGTSEYEVCEIVRGGYHERIERARRAS